MSVIMLKPKFINWYKTNKLSTITGFVVLLFLVLLDMGRFKSSANSVTKELSTNAIEPLILPTFTNDAFALLESTYKNFSQNQEQQSDIKTQVMSAVEQEKQQGELDSLFVGGNKLKLKAVVSYNIQEEGKILKQAYYALIEIANLTQGERVIQKYQHKDDVFGYQLIITQNQQVQLVAQGNKAKRIINLVMYQKPKSSVAKKDERALFNQGKVNQNNINKSSE